MKVAIIAVVAILLVLVLWYIATYNGFVKLRNFVQESWRQIDVELKRRRDLIPNLVETVRGYMAHEQMTLQAVVEARRMAEAPATSLAQRSQSESALSGALSRLFAVAENYPTLRADTSFLNLQQELTNTEDRIAAGRRFYNSNVRDLNTKAEKFPSSIVAPMMTLQKAEYFEVDSADRQLPQVSFGGFNTPPTAGFGGQSGQGQPGYGPQKGGMQPGYGPQGGGMQPGYGRTPGDFTPPPAGGYGPSAGMQ